MKRWENSIVFNLDAKTLESLLVQSDLSHGLSDDFARYWVLYWRQEGLNADAQMQSARLLELRTKLFTPQISTEMLVESFNKNIVLKTCTDYSKIQDNVYLFFLLCSNSDQETERLSTLLKNALNANVLFCKQFFSLLFEVNILEALSNESKDKTEEYKFANAKEDIETEISVVDSDARIVVEILRNYQAGVELENNTKQKSTASLHRLLSTGSVVLEMEIINQWIYEAVTFSSVTANPPTDRLNIEAVFKTEHVDQKVDNIVFLWQNLSAIAQKDKMRFGSYFFDLLNRDSLFTRHFFTRVFGFNYVYFLTAKYMHHFFVVKSDSEMSLQLDNINQRTLDKLSSDARWQLKRIKELKKEVLFPIDQAFSIHYTADNHLMNIVNFKESCMITLLIDILNIVPLSAKGILNWPDDYGVNKKRTSALQASELADILLKQAPVYAPFAEDWISACVAYWLSSTTLANNIGHFTQSEQIKERYFGRESDAKAFEVLDTIYENVMNKRASIEESVYLFWYLCTMCYPQRDESELRNKITLALKDMLNANVAFCGLFFEKIFGVVFSDVLKHILQKSMMTASRQWKLDELLERDAQGFPFVSLEVYAHLKVVKQRGWKKLPYAEISVSKDILGTAPHSLTMFIRGYLSNFIKLLLDQLQDDLNEQDRSCYQQDVACAEVAIENAHGLIIERLGELREQKLVQLYAERCHDSLSYMHYYFQASLLSTKEKSTSWSHRDELIQEIQHAQACAFVATVAWFKIEKIQTCPRELQSHFKDYLLFLLHFEHQEFGLFSSDTLVLFCDVWTNLDVQEKRNIVQQDANWLALVQKMDVNGMNEYDFVDGWINHLRCSANAGESYNKLCTIFLRNSLYRDVNFCLAFFNRVFNVNYVHLMVSFTLGKIAASDANSHFLIFSPEKIDAYFFNSLEQELQETLNAVMVKQPIKIDKRLFELISISSVGFKDTYAFNKAIVSLVVNRLIQETQLFCSVLTTFVPLRASVEEKPTKQQRLSDFKSKLLRCIEMQHIFLQTLLKKNLVLKERDSIPKAQRVLDFFNHEEPIFRDPSLDWKAILKKEELINMNEFLKKMHNLWLDVKPSYSAAIPDEYKDYFAWMSETKVLYQLLMENVLALVDVSEKENLRFDFCAKEVEQEAEKSSKETVREQLDDLREHHEHMICKLKNIESLLNIDDASRWRIKQC